MMSEYPSRGPQSHTYTPYMTSLSLPQSAALLLLSVLVCAARTTSSPLAAAQTVQAMAAAASSANSTVVVHKIGTVDILLAETTPIVFGGRLVRLESVHYYYPENALGGRIDYLRFRDVELLNVSVPFGIGYTYGCAYVDITGGTETIYVYATPYYNVDRKRNSVVPQIGTHVRVFRTSDMADYTTGIALQFSDAYRVENTNVWNGPNGTYIMALEMSSPSVVVGPAPATIFFASSSSLFSNWSMLDEGKYFYSKEILTDCPMIRFFPDSGMYYLLTMQFDSSGICFMGIARSMDLSHWEASNSSVLYPSIVDHSVAPFNSLTPEQLWLVHNSTDICNSDIDSVEVMTPSGPVVYINSAWGNQSNTYYFLESAVVLMGLEEWMESYF